MTGPQRWATPTPELTLFYSEELEWSFEKIDGVGVELELKFLIRLWSWSGVLKK
jgi:hypothetical protein